jgi:hypothetical protein
VDLLAITSGAVGAVNPLTVMTVQISTGSTVAPDGKRTPTYATPVTPMGQVQPLSGEDLKQLDALNIQGSLRAIYLEGHIDGIVRSKNKGGDLVTDGSGNVWLVTHVLEFWPDWCKVAVMLQNGS